jgi:ankyrin repeat protein
VQPDGVQLWLAASEDDVPGTISLLDKGAPIDWQWDEKDSMLDGWTALLTACNNGAPEVAKVLVGRGANLEATTNTGRTALMTAAVAGEPSVCIALLQAGADSTARDIEGKTALDLARWASQQWTSADRPGCIAVLEVWAGGVRTQLALNAAGNLL